MHELTYPMIRPICSPLVRDLVNGDVPESDYVFTNPEAEAYVAAMAVEPDGDRKAVIDSLVTNIGAAILAKLGGLYLLAAHDAQAARLDMCNPAGTALTAVNSPVFTVDRGYKGDGATAYLDTGRSIASFGGSQNDFMCGTHCNVAPDTAAQSRVFYGVNNAANAARTQIQGIIGTSDTQHVVNTGTNSNWATGAGFLRHFAQRRATSGTQELYSNGALVNSGAVASSALPGGNMFLLARNNNGTGAVGLSDARITYWWAGAGMSAGEIATLTTALGVYLTAVGAV